MVVQIKGGDAVSLSLGVRVKIEVQPNRVAAVGPTTIILSPPHHGSSLRTQSKYRVGHFRVNK